MGTRRARCSLEPPMCETLLLANPDTNTLRPVRSRASTHVLRTSTASRVFTAAIFWWVCCLVCAVAFVDHDLIRSSLARSHSASIFGELAAHSLRPFSSVTAFRTYGAVLLGGLAAWSVVPRSSAEGFSRIARGVPWAGSVTGGEACGYLCTEKEGFKHWWFWRAPCSSGTNE